MLTETYINVAAGGTSSFFASITLQPLDVLKTRIQNSKTSLRMIPTVSSLLQKEGASGLWRGVTPSIYRTVPGVAGYFTLLNCTKAKILGCDVSAASKQSLSPGLSFMTALACRSIVATTLLPFTVIKTRYESGLFNYTSTWDALRKIAQTEKIRGLYTGTTATLMRDAPFSALYFTFYESFRSTLREQKNISIMGANLETGSIPTPVVNLCAGMSAGMVATAATHPADVIRARMQLDSKQRYPTLTKTAFRLYLEGGFKIFYRGVVPRTLRRTMMSAITWTMYEEI
eukprot:Pgem_evm1s9266